VACCKESIADVIADVLGSSNGESIVFGLDNEEDIVKYNKNKSEQERRDFLIRCRWYLIIQCPVKIKQIARITNASFTLTILDNYCIL
jgi:hypothetical protein